jgi:rSAM/selenodomain-associated transferase 1
MQETLIIFSRYPEAGKTKTRMIPALGKQGAALLQKRLTEHLLINLEELTNINVEIYFSGGNYHLMQEWLGTKLTIIKQKEGDLGFKMKWAFESSFNKKQEKVVLIGTDTPDLNIKIINEAFSKLSNCDLILGPSADGGYYLIGLSHYIPELFSNINWGTCEVFRQTKKIAQELNLITVNLPILADVDRPEDLQIWEKYI